MVKESVTAESDRSPLTLVDPTAETKRSANEPRSTRRVKSKRSKSPTEVETKSVEIDTLDNAAKDLRVAKDLRDDKNALGVFRNILIALVSEAQSEGDPPKLSRNPLTRFRRYLEGEPGFEEMVGNYASLLSVLAQPVGLAYCKTALVGIKALRTRRLGIARAVFEEVRYRTSPSAALLSVMKGVGLFLLILLFLIIALPSGWFAIVKTFNLMSADTMLSNQSSITHISAAILSGFIGSVVSLLLRLAEFENTRGKSKEFLFLYGLTLPVVGGVFAAVIAALLDAKVISALGDGTQVYILAGFLSGFSERFTRSLLSIAENSLSPPSAVHERHRVSVPRITGNAP
jgi:hypothetical protein